MSVEIIELCSRQNPLDYTPGRSGGVRLLVCHDTSGPNDLDTITDPDEARSISDQATEYLLSNDRRVSCHYVIGHEAAGPLLYHVAHEYDTAYHCGGSPPDHLSHWTDPDTNAFTTAYGNNDIALGIERVGQAGGRMGPNQTEALEYLLRNFSNVGILGRHPILKNPLRIVSHASIQNDRTDGTGWVDLARRVATGEEQINDK